jgi:hypothetical protein
VLSIPTFSSPDVNSFQDIARKFINMSVAMGKQKMIFDMRGNGGGNAILGYDMFKQVFPQADQEPFGATQFRAFDDLNTAGQMTAIFNKNKALLQVNESLYNDVLALNSVFNFEHTLDINNDAFSSWGQMFGPHARNNDQFTSILRYNFSDPISDTYPGFSLIGLLNDTESPDFQPFKPENMVMVSSLLPYSMAERKPDLWHCVY